MHFLAGFSVHQTYGPGPLAMAILMDFTKEIVPLLLAAGADFNYSALDVDPLSKYEHNS